MTTTLTVEQRKAMGADMAEFQHATALPLSELERTRFEIIWLSGYAACLEEERATIKARIEAVQRGGGTVSKPLEIDRMLTLSLAHLSKSTAANMHKYGDRKSTYGWYVWPQDIEELPTDLAACAAFAKQHGCEWLTFDEEGDVIEDLPVYGVLGDDAFGNVPLPASEVVS